MKTITLGENKVVENKGNEAEVFEGKVEIQKESEKAILVRFDFTGKEFDVEYDSEPWDEEEEWHLEGEANDEWTGGNEWWIPKSQIEISENEILIPEWVAEQKKINIAK
jgi:hypothetical protein